MRKKMMTRKAWFYIGLLGLVFLVACGGAPQMVEVEVTRTVMEVQQDIVTDAETVELEEELLMFDEEEMIELEGETLAEVANEAERTQSNSTKRLIIKQGNMEIEVEDSQKTIVEVNNLAAATGGFILEQRVWELDGYTYATIRLSVPVVEFERSMNALRRLGEVTVDAATGQDVTDEYIDLESRLGNLQATQERLRSFLEEAKKIEDVLEINKELTKVEEELSIIQGRMNYLADRAAFSSIQLAINPLVPTPTPSPTPTMTPTATPTPVPEWRPAETARDAGATLQTAGQNTADFLIWNLIACGPWLLLIGVIGMISWRIWQPSLPSISRRQPRSAVPPRESPITSEGDPVENSSDK